MASRNDLDILYVEDEKIIREAVSLGIEAACGNVRTAGDGVDALRMIREKCPDVVVTDIRMPNMDGLELTALLRHEFPDLAVIITTAFTETDYLLRAIDLGVRACIRKPINYGQLTSAIKSAGQPALLRRQVAQLKSQAEDSLLRELGVSPPMCAVAEQATAVADSNFSIMIQGEAGVGKVHLAGLIHDISDQHRYPYSVVSCDGVAAELLERELFGMKRWGAGRLAVSSGGTVVLHHLDAMPLTLQRKLQRAIAEKSYQPLGETKTLPLEVRFIATLIGTVQDAITAGRLDAALCYALSDQCITMPPLRSLPEDIPRLAALFLAEALGNRRHSSLRLDGVSSQFLTEQPWPGNIRQLRSVMRRVALFGHETISVTTLQSLLSDAATTKATPPAEPHILNIDKLEYWAICEALEQCGGKKMQAATLVGLDYKRFKRKLEKHGLNLPE
ncbi:MAG: sigma-54-dependent Fis family transcriptional regulator [Deltaproteobacteria bacterium]|jgi:DNA-binding NtrC family response regulator|nr:sigma-54-dependent Fis family transcriptional regulator [Deltaproteobacteria bacterium]